MPQPLCAWVIPRPSLLRFPDIFLEGSPNKTAGNASPRRELFEDGGAAPYSQLKTNLGFWNCVCSGAAQILSRLT
jgi:hypothetical protein